MNRQAVLAWQAEGARCTLRHHCWGRGKTLEDGEATIIDLLADLRHYCDRRALPYGHLDAQAHRLYLEQREAAR